MGTARMVAAAMLLASLFPAGASAAEEPFDDPLFRRCIGWMLTGNGGALIDNLCADDFAIPPPSLFSCARKVMTRFHSDTDREACALIFEEQARKARSGYVR